MCALAGVSAAAGQPGQAVLQTYSCALHWWIGVYPGVLCAYLTLSLPLSCGDDCMLFMMRRSSSCQKCLGRGAERVRCEATRMLLWPRGRHIAGIAQAFGGGPMAPKLL